MRQESCVARQDICRAIKIVDIPGVSACRATSFEYLRHIHLSLRQATTYPSITSKSCSLSYYNIPDECSIVRCNMSQ